MHRNALQFTISVPSPSTSGKRTKTKINIKKFGGTPPLLDRNHPVEFVPFVRDGPDTTTTIIFPKSFASDATPKRHLVAHQMTNLCGFSVFHCVEGTFGASSGGIPKMKNGAARDELKNGRGRGWALP